jgi:hypothetical protein
MCAALLNNAPTRRLSQIYPSDGRSVHDVEVTGRAENQAHRWVSRGWDSGLRRGALGCGAAGLLLGCPQMLSDEFTVSRADAAFGAGGDGGSGSGLQGGFGGEVGLGGTAGSSAAAGTAGLEDNLVTADAVSALSAVLAHRYSFEGSGTIATDSVGAAPGELSGVTLDGSGYVALADGAFVDLPNGIASASNDRTFEVWLTWQGGDGFQRIFDLGSNDAGEGEQGAGASYIFLSPDAGAAGVRGGCTKNGVADIVWIDGVSSLAVGRLTHLALVVDSQSKSASIYFDGQPDGTGALEIRLSEINDVNNWLGRPQVAGHPDLGADIHEFRVYADALSAAQVALSFEFGPDTGLFD